MSITTGDEMIVKFNNAMTEIFGTTFMDETTSTNLMTIPSTAVNVISPKKKMHILRF